MAITAQQVIGKKRNRLSMSRICDDQEEYERAVAFLREFHSRRVAATRLHSMPLDAILEADNGNGSNSFDEMLASDFALALSVGTSSTPSPMMSTLSRSKPSSTAMTMKSSKESMMTSSSSPPANKRPRGLLRRTSSNLFGMKKKVASGEQLSSLLGNNSNGASGGIKGGRSKSISGCSINDDDDTNGYLLGHDHDSDDEDHDEDDDDDDMANPVSKRHRHFGIAS